MTERVSRLATTADPNLIWNRFISMIGRASADELEGPQKLARLVFGYESEVQNGGHLQFLLNVQDDIPHQTIPALQALGAGAHAELLKRAVEMWIATQREAPQTTEEFIDLALEGKFADLDAEFYSLAPPLTDVLQSHLDQNLTRYFVLKD